MLLSEIRALRNEFTTFAGEMRERVTATETQMYSLMGNGQPGRVTLLERAVDKLQQWRWQVVGMAAGASTVISVIAWLVERMH